jgi:hypothetical protein
MTRAVAATDFVEVEAQVDGGSNSMLLASHAAARAASRIDASGTIGGIADGLAYDGVSVLSAEFSHHTASGAASTPHTLAWLHTPRGHRNIISESVLLDEYGIETVKPRTGPAHLSWPDGSSVPLTRRNGLWFATLRLSAPPPAAGAPLPAAIANAAVRADDHALLWAARLDTDADGLLRLAASTRGIDISSLSARQREAIASNQHRAVAQARHAPVDATPLADRATEPASTLVCDGFGKHHAASPIDGAVYQFSAVCEYSSFGYIASGKTHTVDDWLGFLRSVILDARARGHTPRRVRFDRAPELAAPELKRRVEAELGIIVELTPREHHEGVGRAERNHDLLTRTAEAMLQRCELGTQWLLPARAYAQWLLNRKPMRATGETRYQRYLRQVPDLSSPVPYAFGTTVAIVEDVRGPKGSLTHPRGSIGRLVGVEGSSYLVYRPQRGGVVHQSHVRPLNELALIRSGLPAAVATVDAGTQTDAEAAPTGAPPPSRRTAPARPPPPTIDIALKTRVEVLWREHGTGTPAWWAGSVVDARDMSTGRRRHLVQYDGFSVDEAYWHDLASDDFEWRRLDEPAAAAPSARGPRTRARTRATAAVSFVDAVLEATPEHATVDRFNAAIFQLLGDAGERFECSSAAALDASRGQLAASDSSSLLAVPFYSLARGNKIGSAPDNFLPVGNFYFSRFGNSPNPEMDCLQAHTAASECMKATQNIVDVHTDVGVQQLTIPSTYRQLLRSEQRDQWVMADQKALDAILAHPGNVLVSTSVPHALGAPIAPCVTQRKVKIDPATQRLASNNAFKSRHCVDGNRLSALLERSGNALEAETSSAVADDLLIKLLFADAATRDRDLVKADVPNAYPQGHRLHRPKTYMALPSAFAHMRADDGSELCIELTTPMWGEGPAGFEWQVELESSLVAIGWRRAEGVPALWTFSGPEGDARLITIVDDLLFSESSSSAYSISERTIALLSEKYGDLRPEREPTSYAGFKIDRDRARRSLTLSMPQKIIEAAREHAPELLSDSPPPALSSAAFQRLADSLALVPLRDGHRRGLSREQRRIQQIIGSLKFIERLHPRLSLALHRLSCVMSSPPPEAFTVARDVLAAAYAERDVGLTFGGTDLAASPRLGGHLKAFIDLTESPPADLEAHADATWGDRNVYGLILTYGGGTVAHSTKKIALIVDSSMESEAIASSKAGELTTYAREILRALGVPADGPTLIGTDNLANQKVGSGVGCPSRSKHFLRRYFALKQRIADGDVELRHVDDENMPADFLTKWIGKSKFETSIQYATNSRSRARAAAAAPTTTAHSTH